MSALRRLLSAAGSVSSEPRRSAFRRTLGVPVRLKLDLRAQVGRSAFEQTDERRSLTWQTAAWGAAVYLALVSGAVSAEQPLGRLFFTPQQRATLEALRLAPAAASAAGTPSDRVSVDGIVQRSGGPATVWINGVPQTVSPRSLVPSAKGEPAAVEVPVPARDKRVRLRVGETLIIAPTAGESDPNATAKPGAGSRPTDTP